MRRLLALSLISVGACGGDDGGGQTVTVLAASSLTDALTEIAAAFEAARPGMTVELSFDGSSRLATAIVEGAPADLFASADEATMERVVDEGQVDGDPVAFASTRLQIVVAAGNPLGIESLADLGDVSVALCQPAVPCGSYARQAFAQAGLDVPEAGDQENVRGVLAQVQLGEADAGLVYATDVLGTDGVDGVDLGAGVEIDAAYTAASLDDQGQAFLAFLRSGEATAILREHGFDAP